MSEWGSARPVDPNARRYDSFRALFFPMSTFLAVLAYVTVSAIRLSGGATNDCVESVADIGFASA